MRELACRLSFLVFLAMPLTVLASDWPRFRGSNADGRSAEKGINKDWTAKPPKELWKANLSDTGYSGAAVAGGKVFIIDHNNNEDLIRAIDLNKGTDLWTYKYPSTYGSMSMGGDPDWGFGRSTPSYSDGLLFVLNPLGVLTCIDAEKGSKVWERDIKKDFGGKKRKEDWNYAESPAIDGDKVIVCPGGPGAAMVALDKKTGKDIWKGGGDDQAGYGSIVIANIEGKKQYVVMTGFAAIGVDAEKGALLWSYPWPTDFDVNAATPVISGNNVFISSGYNHGCALLEIAGGKATKVWENKEIKAHFNAPVLVNGYLYGVGDPGTLVCVEFKTGKLAWKKAGFEKGGVLEVDGMIVAVDGRDGNIALVAADPAEYKELGRIHPLTGRHWPPPVVADGKLIVRNRPNMVCLDLK